MSLTWFRPCDSAGSVGATSSSLDKYLLGTPSVPGPVLGAGGPQGGEQVKSQAAGGGYVLGEKAGAEQGHT